MAKTPAQRHLERTLAAQAAASNAGGRFMEGTGIYEQMLVQLASDRSRLKLIQSGEGKGLLKAELLPQYDAYVEGVLAADQGGTDDVVTTVMLWNIDAGRYSQALHLAAYVLRHGLAMPDRFERTTGCVVAEEVADAALNALRSGSVFDIAILRGAAELTRDQDMPDQVRAKLLLALGRWLMYGVNKALGASDNPPVEAVVADTTESIEAFRRAIQLHDGCGGKKDLERAESVLKKYTASQPIG